MAAHRYWRLLLIRNNGGSRVSVGELELRTEVGGADQATGGVASASSQYSASWSADKAFDNVAATNSGSGWLSADFPATSGGTGAGTGEWLQYDFGAGNEKDIVEIAIANGTYSTYGNMPRAFHFQYSDDGVTWTTARSVLDETAWSATGTTRAYPVTPLGPSAVTNRMVMPTYHSGQEKPEVVADLVSADCYRLMCDIVFGGQFKLSGSTTSLGYPASRRVRLYHQYSGEMARQAVTEDDGSFEFTNIEEGPWTVVGVDDTGVQNGVLFTHVLAVPM